MQLSVMVPLRIISSNWAIEAARRTRSCSSGSGSAVAGVRPVGKIHVLSLMDEAVGDP